MKKFIIATSVTACIALCAAVWAQSETVEETPAPALTAAVYAAGEACAKPEATEFIPTEDEITAVPQAEEVQEIQLVLEPFDIPTASETQPVHEQTSAPAPTQEPAPAQTSNALQPGDLVYVPGFGWVPYEGPNHCEDGTNIYKTETKSELWDKPGSLLTKQIAIQLILK